jgi:hypothetical protein
MVFQAPATATDLANLALDLLANNKALLDIESDTSSIGNALRRAFWQSWDETLQAAPWNCARKRAALAALTEEPSWGFDYYYALPGDYINLQEIDGLYEGQQWNVEETDAGVKAIACDLDAPLYIAYTYQLRDIAKATPLFRGAFIAHLAATTAQSITKSDSIEAKCWNIFNTKIGQAQGADGREGARKPMPDSQIVSIRD